MAGELIGALRVSLGLDSAKFEDGLKKSRSRAQTEATAIQKSLNGIKTGLTGLVAGLSVGTLVAAGKRALDYASSLGEVAQQLGVTATELQEYRYAATQAGISTDEMDKSLAKLTRTMGEAKAGGKTQSETFKELGTAVESAVVAGRSAGEVLPLIADALAKIDDPAKRARIEVDLFGRAGQKLDTLLSGGSAAINRLRDAAHRLGVVLSEEQIQKADETADKLAAIKMVLEANIAGIVANNSSAILSLADAFTTAARAAGFLINQIVDLKRGASLYMQENGRLAMNAKAITDPEELRKYGRVVRFREALDAAGVAKPKSVATPSGSLPSAGGRVPKGRSGPSASDRAENYSQELFDLQNEQLGLQQDINADIRDRARMEHDRIETERAAYAFDLDTKVRAGQLNAADAERLSLVAARNTELKHTAINWRLDDEMAQQELSIRRENLQTQTDLLRDQAGVARTISERRDIELKILDHQIELERLALQAVLAMHSSTQTEKEIATARLAQLGKLRSGAAANIEQSNLGHLAAYMDSLPRTAAEVDEAFQAVAANGVANMVDGLAEAGANVLKLKGFAGQLFNQLIADTIRLNLQAAMGGGGGLLGAIGKLFGAVSPTNFISGIAASNSAAFSSMPSLPKFAGGGSFQVLGKAGVDMNQLALNDIPIAHVSKGERISVDPKKAANNNSPVMHFDLRGAVMTQDLLNQMNAIGATATVQGAAGGSVGAQRAIAQRQSRRLA
jgi:hypothetical protein